MKYQMTDSHEIALKVPFISKKDLTKICYVFIYLIETYKHFCSEYF